MNTAVVALVLVAVAFHAGWNTLLRGGADRLWSMSMINVAVGTVALATVGLPDRASWPFVVVSGAASSSRSARR